MKVYAVQFSNYEPAEVEGLYATRALAEARIEQLGRGLKPGEWNGWQVCAWTVAEELPPDEPETTKGPR